MYTLESRVRYSECDKTRKLSLVGAMNYLQDCSSFHSEHIGRGFEALAQEHLAWVLASWQIEVARMPRFNEKITVGTWAYELGGLSASRCFVILDEKGYMFRGCRGEINQACSEIRKVQYTRDARKGNHDIGRDKGKEIQKPRSNQKNRCH